MNGGSRTWTPRRIAAAALLAIAVAFGVAAAGQPAPSAGESVLGTGLK